jgi:hypothetical protein
MRLSNPFPIAGVASRLSDIANWLLGALRVDR